MKAKKNKVERKNTGGKRVRSLRSSFDSMKVYTPKEALEFIQSSTVVKFDATTELTVKLGVDPKHADQMVRGTVVLPHGTGKKVKVAVFARDAKAKEAKEAGADIVGAEDLVDQIVAGNIDFDACVATPDMMPLLGKVAKILGPKGLMPNPKLGNVTVNVGDAVNQFKAGKIEYRVEKAGIVHAPIGKVKFKLEHLKENFEAIVNAIVKSKPAGAKGQYIKGVFLSSTMLGVSLPIDIAAING